MKLTKMNNVPKLSPEEYHEWHKKTYRGIPLTKQTNHFKSVMRGGEPYVIQVDNEGNEINPD